MKNLTVVSVAVLTFALGLGGVGCGSPPPAATPPTDATPPTTTGADKDGDGDGIPDSMDKCLDKKEDGLGPMPKDGCPNAKP
jgi:hypothetical protein